MGKGTFGCLFSRSVSSFKTQHTQAIQALNRGQYRRAAELARALLLEDDAFADGWFIMGMVAAANVKITKALELIGRAVALAPGNPEYLAQQAKLFVMTNDHARARGAALEASTASSLSALTADTLGVVFSKLGDFARSKTFFLEAVEKAPRHPQFTFNLASTSQFLGEMDGAARHYEEAIRLAPTFYRAHWALAELNKNDPDLATVPRLERYFAKNDLKADAKLYLGHSLYYAYEKLGRFDDAFAALTKGKQARIAQITYSIRRDERLIEALEANLPEENGQDDGERLVFIVGMPRTGTTLIEQILDSHPNLTSLGERDDLSLSLKRVSGDQSPVVMSEEIVAAAARARTDEIASIYQRRIIEAARQLGVGADQRLIDKMPLNFLLMGFIYRTFPRAKVIVVRRHPLDTVFSNFRQLFAINYSFYNYAFDVGDTAGYFALFDRLMAHWRDRFPNRYFEISYEALTDAPEAEVRRLLDHLDVPWSEKTLRFHENTRAVSTASTAQVRSPLYRSAVARWRKYEAFLGPAKVILDRHGVRYQDDLFS